MIDKVFTDTAGEEANAIVHGARWLSNEYEYTYSVPAGSIGHTNCTITANMGDEDILSKRKWILEKLKEQSNDTARSPRPPETQNRQYHREHVVGNGGPTSNVFPSKQEQMSAHEN